MRTINLTHEPLKIYKMNTKIKYPLMPILAMEMMMPSIATTKGNSYSKSIMPAKEWQNRKKRIRMANKSRSINRRK